MRAIRTIIVDDEVKSRETLRAMLNLYCEDTEIVGESGNIEEAKILLADTQPDLLFLDISMPGGSGFDLLSHLDEIRFEVIFVTAYHEYAIQALRNNAVDYLLKPVNITELQQAIDRVKGKKKASGTSSQMRDLLSALGGATPAARKMAIPDRNGLRFIDVQEIIRLEASGSYTEFHMTGGQKVISTRQLKDFEGSLPPHNFFRAHHSHIINLDHVKYYERGEGGTIVMNDNSSISLAKRKKKHFMDIFRL